MTRPSSDEETPNYTHRVAKDAGQLANDSAQNVLFHGWITPKAATPSRSRNSVLRGKNPRFDDPIKVDYCNKGPMASPSPLDEVRTFRQ